MTYGDNAANVTKADLPCCSDRTSMMAAEVHRKLSIVRD